ncbi:MAG: TolB protein [Acidimicrobiaceae bacterium]|jgi:hypothetical protein
MDDESLRSRFEAAAPPAAPGDAQLAAIQVRAQRLRSRRSRQAVLGGVAALVLIAAGALVAARGPKHTTNVDITAPTTSSSPSSNSSAPETTVVDSTVEPTTVAVTEPPPLVPPPFGDGGGKLLYTSPSDSARQGLSAASGNGTENGPLPLPAGVTDVSGPQWSPDRSKIAFAAGSNGIWVMSANGSGARHLTVAFDMSPVWSPDGASILVRRVGDPQQLVIVSAASGAEVASAVADAGGYWAPDSSGVAFVDHVTGPGAQQHPGNVFVLPRNGGAPAQLTHDADSSASIYYYTSAWEPNGRVTYARYAGTGAGTFTSLADGSDVIQLSDRAATVAWSPSRLAALSGSRSEVSIVTDHGAIVASISATDASAAWSPDGSALAVAAVDRLSFVRPNGSTITTINGLSLAGAGWSPDGQLFAGIQDLGPEGGELVVASIDGATATIGPYSGLMCCGVWVDW